jgi:hypothetical protein
MAGSATLTPLMLLVAISEGGHIIYVIFCTLYEALVLGPRPRVMPWGPTTLFDAALYVCFLIFWASFGIYHGIKYNRLVEQQEYTH